MIFDDTLKRIEDNLKKEDNCIPLPLTRFSQVMPGIMQKTYTIITANSGVGKSQLTDYLYLYHPIDYMLSNPQANLKIKVFYYSLEMDKESKVVQGIAKNLYKKYGLVVPYNKILSYTKNRITAEELQLINKEKQYFDNLEEYVQFIDKDYVNPYAIYKDLYNYAVTSGTIHKKQVEYKELNVLTGKQEIKYKEVFDYYEPNNPNEYVFIIIDHISLIGTEKESPTIKLAMEKLSSHLRTLRNNFGYIPVVVQQQAASSEEQEFFRGQSIESKLIPSLQGLAESKLTARDANIVLGLFSPARYELASFRGYNVTQFQDNFRSLHLLKYRNGTPNSIVGLFFNGASNYFEELPKPDEFIQNPKLLEKYKNEIKKIWQT